MGSWISIPLFTGFRFTKGDSRLRGYLQLQGGMNFGTQSKTAYGNMRFETGWATSAGIGRGAGFMARKFHFGIRYCKIAEAKHTLTFANDSDFGIVDEAKAGLKAGDLDQDGIPARADFSRTGTGS
jgi:hypothetical protein